MPDNRSIRDELLELQHNLYQQILKSIEDYQSQKSKDLVQYERQYLSRVDTFERLSDKNELIREVFAATIVFVGDFHTLRQAQRTLLRILREIVKTTRNIVIAMEMVSVKHQGILDSFMSEQITDQVFLDAIKYKESWDFDWKNYKMIFDFCKKYEIPVYGINHNEAGKKSLRYRDKVAAEKLAEIHEHHVGSLIFCLYGDLHIAAPHIPETFEATLKRKKAEHPAKPLIIHQNVDKLYWDLTEHGLELAADVLKIRDHTYCVMNTPPWVKLQTHLDWVERHQSFLDEEGEEWTEYDETHDYYGRLWNMTMAILDFLDIEPKSMDTFHVYTKGDVAFVDFLNAYLKRLSSFNSFEKEMAEAEIVYNGTCFIPEEEILYFNTLNINKFAEKLAQFIHFKRTKSFLRSSKKGSRKQVYFGRILYEAAGFIGSKVINYKRKSETLEDFITADERMRKRRLKGRAKAVRDISKLCLRHLSIEDETLETGKISRKWQTLYSQDPEIFYTLTRTLGQYLGDRIYDAMLNGHITKKDVIRLFETPIDEDSDNLAHYFKWLRLIRESNPIFKSKSDRF